ncbi:TDT family transporter [Nakamurella deserti]|uniref:TDT family transporter n=1 Tax=Nakamurella deserti TaxID=2164074 RepID=UPI0013009549|nr:TDT family transporter [Nakamurella deserti]
MTGILVPTAAPAPHRWVRFGLLADLADPRSVFAALTPNWYASVMGTGIVAVAAASLTVTVPGLRSVAVGFWGLATFLLPALTVATAVHWWRCPTTARGYLGDPVMAHFYGAPPMALMTVGAATLLVGADVVGERWALGIDVALWIAGTLAGLVGAVVVPYLLVRRHRLTIGGAFGGWLMSVVPPMVSASTGALLVPHLPAGGARVALVVAGYAMVGFSLTASVVVILLLCHRLAVFPPGPARMVPTLWIVLGPLGQSVTAVNLLAGAAAVARPGPTADALSVFGTGYGTVVLVLALGWAGYAVTVTARTVRRGGLPFSLTWWSFTFPVGTCVTGANGMALRTGSAGWAVVAGVLFAVLLSTWLVVAARTAAGSRRGSLFLPVTAR